MTATKQKMTITIDCDIYKAAKTKYPNVSGRINELLSMDLYGSDEKEELVERLHQLKMEEKSITKRICELERAEHIVREEERSLQLVLDWVDDAYSRKGVIGRNQLELICKKHHVNVHDVLRMLEKDGVAIVNYA